ncbi:MAG: sugar transferase [Nitrospirae bacterium]|nr:MAG: sugar transferase [Nitrospirota bacterium]
MLKEQDSFIHKTAISVDCLIVAVSFIFAYSLSSGLQDITILPQSFLNKAYSLREYLGLLIFTLVLWIATLTHFGVYDSMREKGFFRIFWIIFDASLVSVLVFSATAFFLKWEILTRNFILALFVLVVILLTAEKMTVLMFLHYIRKSGYNFRVLLLVGSGDRARLFAQNINKHPEWGVRIFGFVDEKEMIGAEIENSRVIGTFDDIENILVKNVIDEVVFLMPRKWLNSLEDYVMVCEKVGVRATIAVDFFNTEIAKPLIKDMHGWPLLTFDTTPLDSGLLAVKRFIDIAGSFFGLILLAPFFTLIGIGIKLTSKGPVFFRQVRCGTNGREFRIYKFRTMVDDAEKQLKELMKHNELEGPVFKIQKDPRITSIGRILRRTSLDELPQLINVLKGEMSLIGPRPPLPAEVKKYESWQRRRLSLRPGMACIHEVVARNDKDFDRWMKHDLEYIDNWSLKLDARILVKAITVVFRGTGY